MAMIGMVMAFAGSYDKIPTSDGTSDGWLPCDGRTLQRTGVYATLFNIIGTLHGAGDGATTFNIPDFRGYFLRGVTSTSSVDKGLANRIPSPGSSANEAGSLQYSATALPRSSFQASTVSDHSHGDPTWNGQPGPFELAAQNSAGSCRGPGGYDYGAQSAPTTPAGGHSHSIIGGGDEETRPINRYVHWIIKAS
jgi:microcystin-dependent protein